MSNSSSSNEFFARILIVDFGSQYTLLIAKLIRKLNVFAEIILPHEFISYFNQYNPYIYGIILSGSPKSVNTDPIEHKDVWTNLINTCDIPILAICYGAQLLAHLCGAKVITAESREFGKTFLDLLIPHTQPHPLYKDINTSHEVWMSHSDSIIIHLNDPILEVLSRTHNDVVGSFQIKNRSIYGLQFHPEVSHTTIGYKLFYNFIDLTNVPKEWSMNNFISYTINDLQQNYHDQKILVACSGGVDSTVAAVLINKAIGDNMIGVFINNGLLRKNEYSDVLTVYKNMGLNVLGLDATNLFYTNLLGAIDPETKRKIIGSTFIDVFKNAHNSNVIDKQIKFLGQGTIYSDIIESKGKIKSHHNVGGLPTELNLQLVEPLKYLFKDEVREIGLLLGIDPLILNRHPFPGPGLGIRILGDITPQKVLMLQEADAIFIQKLKDHNLYSQVWQAGVILLNCQSVGVQGDCRTYESVVALRAVCSLNGMTAKVATLSTEFLSDVSTEIINKVKGINRVVYDVTTKPPGTIEWE